MKPTTLAINVFHASEHLAELGEYIDDITLSVDVTSNLTINVVSNATSRVTIAQDNSIVFDATEDFDGNIELIVFDVGGWTKNIISEYESLTAKTGRS